MYIYYFIFFKLFLIPYTVGTTCHAVKCVGHTLSPTLTPIRPITGRIRALDNFESLKTFLTLLPFIKKKNIATANNLVFNF